MTLKINLHNADEKNVSLRVNVTTKNVAPLTRREAALMQVPLEFQMAESMNE